MLFSAGWWLPGVYAFHHHASQGPWRPRDVTHLPPWKKTRVVLDPGQLGFPAGEGIGVGMLPGRPMFHPTPKILEGQEPAGHPGVSVFGGRHPPQWLMVRHVGELPP